MSNELIFGGETDEGCDRTLPAGPQDLQMTIRWIEPQFGKWSTERSLQESLPSAFIPRNHHIIGRSSYPDALILRLQHRWFELQTTAGYELKYQLPTLQADMRDLKDLGRIRHPSRHDQAMNIWMHTQQTQESIGHSPRAYGAHAPFDRLGSL
jgi:hypothetical protein